jgi:hypothetical protein
LGARVRNLGESKNDYNSSQCCAPGRLTVEMPLRLAHRRICIYYDEWKRNTARSRQRRACTLRVEQKRNIRGGRDMSIRRNKIGSALHFGLGAALLAASVFMSASATAAPMAICSASDPSSPTGRQYARVSPSPRPAGYCVREALGGVADSTVPDCWTAARDAGFDCSVKIVDR